MCELLIVARKNSSAAKRAFGPARCRMAGTASPAGLAGGLGTRSVGIEGVRHGKVLRY